jgi:hypothetical protein
VLRAPLAYRHPAGDAARRVTPGPPKPPTALSKDAFAEDEVVLVAGAAALTDGKPFRINDADPARLEYRVAVMPSAVTDARGCYRLGPVARVSNLTLTVTPPAPPNPPAVTYFVDYDRPFNVADLTA